MQNFLAFQILCKMSHEFTVKCDEVADLANKLHPNMPIIHFQQALEAALCIGWGEAPIH